MRVPEYLKFTKRLTADEIQARKRRADWLRERKQPPEDDGLVEVQVEFTDHFGSVPRRYIDADLLKLMIDAVAQEKLMFMSFDEWAMRLLDIRYPAAEGRALIRVRKVNETDCLPQGGWRPARVRSGEFAVQDMATICAEQVCCIQEETRTQMRVAARDIRRRFR